MDHGRHLRGCVEPSRCLGLEMVVEEVEGGVTGSRLVSWGAGAAGQEVVCWHTGGVAAQAAGVLLHVGGDKQWQEAALTFVVMQSG